MSLDRLTTDWQAWVRENTARRCSRESMLPLLVGGGYAQDVAELAILQASAESPPQPDGLPGDEPVASVALSPLTKLRPSPDLAANAIRCGDHLVRVATCLDRPRVVLFDQVLTDAECDSMVALADARLTRSTVVDELLGDARPHAHRTSSGAWFHRAEHPLLADVEQRIAQLLDWPVENGEGLQVLRYEIGGEYRAHYDYFNPTSPGSERHLKTGGQRVATLILYLSDVAAGGGTRFPSIGLEVRPRKGSGVFFADVDADGKVDAATLHAGVPVIAGVKYIATKWLRERSYV